MRKKQNNNVDIIYFVIIGWDEGVLSMKKGEIAQLTCSPDYAYGASGFPAWGIMPNSVLMFEIEVVGF